MAKAGDPGYRQAVSAFLFSLVAVVLASLGARDVAILAGLAARQGRRPAMLVLAALSAIATAVVMGWLATRMLPMLGPVGRGVLAAMLLALAGAEMLLRRPFIPPSEPTRSLGAGALVLLAQQATDAPRMLVLGIAVGLAAPLPAAAGGALGGILAMIAAQVAGEAALTPGFGRCRRLIGALLLLAAALTALRVL